MQNDVDKSSESKSRKSKNSNSEESDSEEEVKKVFSRTNRGRQMNKLLDKENLDKMDDEFWSGNKYFHKNQLKEQDHEDEEAQSDQERGSKDSSGSDSADSDFDQPENEDNKQAEQGDQPVNDKENANKLKQNKDDAFRPIKVGLDKKQRWEKMLRKASKKRRRDYNKKTNDWERMERLLDSSAQAKRKSHRENTVIKTIDTNQRLTQAIKDYKKKEPLTEHYTSKNKKMKMSQKEILEEAAMTELVNLQLQEQHLKKEFQQKKIQERANIHKKEAAIIWRYRAGEGGGVQSSVWLKDDKEYNSWISTTDNSIRQQENKDKELCQITNQKAKYKDPQSSVPQADIDAYKIVKERWQTREEDKLSHRMHYISELLNIKKERLKHKLKQEDKPTDFLDYNEDFQQFTKRKGKNNPLKPKNQSSLLPDEYNYKKHRINERFVKIKDDDDDDKPMVFEDEGDYYNDDDNYMNDMEEADQDQTQDMY